MELNPAPVPRQYPEESLIVEPHTNYRWRQFCLLLGFKVPQQYPIDIEQPPLTLPDTNK